MDSLTDDVSAIVLARLPLKTITASKLVCKRWKSIVESPFFRDLFLSLHQKSPSSSWWLMHMSSTNPEYVAHYGCDTWGLKRSLGSFISSFLKKKFTNKTDRYPTASMVAYSDDGLILVYDDFHEEKRSLYVANPVSQECVDISPHAFPTGFEAGNFSWDLGIATRTVKGVLLGYKVVSFARRKRDEMDLSFLIYSSDTGLWSLDTFRLPYSFKNYLFFDNPFSLNGELHWLVRNNDNDDVVLSIDLYGTGSDRCRATPFPDVDETTKFIRFCTISQGFLMYMNIVSPTDGSLEDRLCVWRLHHEEGWQLVSEISPDFILTGFDYFPLTINPFDAKTAYFWSKEQQRLLSINLHNGKFVLHNQLERLKYGCIMIPVQDTGGMVLVRGLKDMQYMEESSFSQFVLPQWLHRIPRTVRRV
ncbi:unnamed protein product [Microthlaspi erraticum]|uniref:F-box domain-containing protein n=1 Tax=Microthlaspi erraticum TaxID=1685480 RepID=A0A6D2ISJ0_9BRAS|nr:unnamed protein product [Microthlaspi erraticum]